MPWVFLALAIGSLAVAMKTQSMGVAIVALLASLGFMLLAALGWMSARIQGRAQPSAAVLSPEAIMLIRKAREKQEADSATAQAEPASDFSDPTDHDAEPDSEPAGRDLRA